LFRDLYGPRRLPDRGQWPDLGLAAKIIFWLQSSFSDTKYYIKISSILGPVFFTNDNLSVIRCI